MVFLLMPIYAFICPVCRKEAEVFFNMDDSHQVQCSCGQDMKKDYGSMQFAYHGVPNDSVDYDLTGKPIPYSTRGQLKEIAKRHGCEVDFGPNGSRKPLDTRFGGGRKCP